MLLRICHVTFVLVNIIIILSLVQGPLFLYHETALLKENSSAQIQTVGSKMEIIQGNSITNSCIPCY